MYFFKLEADGDVGLFHSHASETIFNI